MKVTNADQPFGDAEKKTTAQVEAVVPQNEVTVPQNEVPASKEEKEAPSVVQPVSQVSSIPQSNVTS